MICPGVQVTLTGPHSLLAVMFASTAGWRGRIAPQISGSIGAVVKGRCSGYLPGESSGTGSGKTTSGGRVDKILSSVATIGYNLSWCTGYIDRTTLIAGGDVCITAGRGGRIAPQIGGSIGAVVKGRYSGYLPGESPGTGSG